MPIRQQAMRLQGRMVGLDLKNGTGVSGIICSVSGNQVFLLQYLYGSQFATFHYNFSQIRAIRRFPKCQTKPPKQQLLK